MIQKTLHLKIKFFVVCLLLLTNFGEAISFVAAANNKPAATAETIYCPLTKKFQPVKLSPKIEKNPLGEICATDAEKEKFSAELLKNLSPHLFQTKENSFDLAFDFWQKGKAAFDNPANVPHLPETFLTRNSFSAAGLNGSFENKIVRQPSGIFNFALKPRPPTELISLAFTFQQFGKLKQISRRIAPRAPPVV